MVTFRFEPLSFLLMSGLVNLARQAHQELEYEHADRPYNPDWVGYQDSEDCGSLRFVSLRDRDNLVGYAAILLQKDLHHTGLLMGIFRDIYIIPGKRGYAAAFVRYIEKEIASLGVNRCLLGERLTSGNEAGKFYQLLGYEPQELILGKNLGGQYETRH